MSATPHPPAPASPDDVRALFNPGSIALVGATDKSGWSSNTFDNLRLHDFTGPVHLVNPRAARVHGQPAHRSLSAVPGPVDLAYVMVPTEAVLPVLEDGAHHRRPAGTHRAAAGQPGRRGDTVRRRV
jgi:acetate---CoA ligase (ADP-forming)